MARIHPDMSITGSLGNISGYKRKDLDGNFVRSKGGPSKDKIKHSPKFENTRRHNAEFGGRARATSWIMRMMQPQKGLADYNIAGPLNAMMKHIQEMDKERELGQRSIELTKSPHILEGFSLNRKHSFDTIIRNHIPYTISHETVSARIDIPALMPFINFYAPFKFPFYSITATLGIVPDLFFHDYHYQTRSGMQTGNEGAVYAQTDWLPVMQGSPAAALELRYNNEVKEDAFSLMLTIGICFGTVQYASNIVQVPFMGSVKVLGMA